MAKAVKTAQPAGPMQVKNPNAVAKKGTAQAVTPKVTRNSKGK